MPSLGTIVVPIDFSDTSRDALRLAAALARTSHGRLHLLHVIPDPLRQAWIVEAPGVDFLGIADQWRRDASERLQQLVREEGLPAADVTIAVPAGQPSEAILQYAQEHEADLIVMGAHGESGVMRFFIGSVAERVVRHSRVPVLTVPRGSLHQTTTTAQTETGAAAR